MNDGTGHCLQGNIGHSALLVDKNGYVYVFWCDFTTNQIYREWSSNNGLTWSAPDLVANGTTLVAAGYRLNGNILAPTTLSASYDPYLHRLAVVWHQRENADYTSPTDSWIATKGAGEAWDVRRLPIPTANDQFMPSVASDLGGGFLATYYSRDADPSNFAYRQYDVYMDGHGNPILTHGPNGNGIEEISSFSSTVKSPPGIEPDSDPGWIGDYQHVTFNQSLGTFQNGWIGRQTSAETSPLDMWLARVQ